MPNHTNSGFQQTVLSIQNLLSKSTTHPPLTNSYPTTTVMRLSFATTMFFLFIDQAFGIQGLCYPVGSYRKVDGGGQHPCEKKILMQRIRSPVFLHRGESYR